MQVSRFFHLRTLKTTGGATVRVTGDTDIPGQVDVQVVFCSKKDPYCKKTGRDLVVMAPVKVVPLRYLPAEMARIQEAMVRKTKCGVVFNDFTFAIKYFLPKE